MTFLFRLEIFFIYFAACFQSNKEPDFDILGWGNNDYGQLGMGTEHRFVTSPTPIDSKNKVLTLKQHFYVSFEIVGNL